MRPATIVFLLCEVAVAATFDWAWIVDNDRFGDLRNIGPNPLNMLVAAYVTALCAGVWEGVAGTQGAQRLLVCAAGPLSLGAWYSVQSVYFADGVGDLLTGLLATALTLPGISLCFAPIWAAVALGAWLASKRA